MNAWEIYTYDPGFGDHPAIIISHPKRVANKPQVEVLLCSSQRAGRSADQNEVMLDTADGLSWETLCKCDLVWSVDKSELHTYRGKVTEARQRKIVSTIIHCHGWSEI